MTTYTNIEARQPPQNTATFIFWAKENLFYSKTSLVLTIILFSIVVNFVVGLLDWFVINATFTGNEAKNCNVNGACWIFVQEKFNQFIYGYYPQEHIWRANLFLIMIFLFSVSLFIRFKFKLYYMIASFIFIPYLSFVLLSGSDLLGLEEVETEAFGGVVLTILLAYLGIIISFPLGLLLALGRRSSLAIIKNCSVVMIEFWRGVPLITVLFMASVILPLFFPVDVTLDKLWRALIGLILFQSAYIAESIRGGLQAIDEGQSEAAKSLSLSYWQSNFLIIIPQALKVAIPNIVGNSIALVKDITLVSIIGLFDILGIAKAATSDSDWLGFEIEGYVFVAFMYWCICFIISKLGIYIEKKFDIEQRNK